MKCQQSFSAHDLRRAVDDWIGKRPS